MSDVKIFVIYHKPYKVFRNEVFEPIQTGADFSGIDLGFLKDNTGDNIAEKNPHYGELTAWYWVARNWLPQHPEVKYVGFCHYRRFFNFLRRCGKFTPPYDPCPIAQLEQLFQTDAFSSKTIERAVSGSDIVLSPKENFNTFRFNFHGSTIYSQYAETHPVEDLDKSIRMYVRQNRANSALVRKFFAGHEFYIGLNFVMRRELFLDWQSWIIAFLDKLGAQCDWQRYCGYNDIRTPAYLAERYFNVWLEEKKLKNDITIREYRRWMVDATPNPTNVFWYLSGVKQWFLRKWERFFQPKVMPAVLQ